MLKKKTDRVNEDWKHLMEAVTGCARDIQGVRRLKRGEGKNAEWRQEGIREPIQKKWKVYGCLFQNWSECNGGRGEYRRPIYDVKWTLRNRREN